MAVGVAARLGMERREHRIRGVALRRVRAQPVERCRERLARHARLVRRALAHRARTAEWAAQVRPECPPRSLRGGGVVVRHARRRRVVGVPGVVRRVERLCRRPRHGRPSHADGRRGGTVRRRPLDPRRRRRDRADARRARRFGAADLPQRHPRDRRRHAHRVGRRSGPLTPPQRQLEARARPSTLGPGAGAARRVHLARSQRPRGPRRHHRVRT